jgi:hypothetical protein
MCFKDVSCSLLWRFFHIRCSGYTAVTFFCELLSVTENLTFTLSSLNCQRLIRYDRMDDEYRIVAPRIYINSFRSKASGRNLFSLPLQPSWVLACDFQFHDYFTDGRTPWTSD